MNIDEKIKIASAYKDTLAQQIKSIEADSAGLAQRHQVLLAAYARVEGGILALEDVKDDMDKEVIE
jgi:hypothetical protein